MKLAEYEVLGELGRGGMGVVLRARAPDGRLVAIKLVQRASKEVTDRFEREKRLLASFSEADGFVALIDHGAVKEGPYIVMPLYEGGTLRKRLDQGALAPDAVRDLGLTLARALGRAHERGVVHRDMKPENVLFTGKPGGASPGVPLIADLGLAKHFADDAPGASQSVSLSRPGELLGTAGYVAPEQLEDARGVGPPSDVFALGAILFEALSGEPTFSGDTAFAVLEKIRLGKRRAVRAACPGAPGPLVAAIEAALATDPAQRPRDGLAFAQLLAVTEAPASRGGLLLGVGVFAGALLGWAATILVTTSSKPPPPAAAPPAVSPAPPKAPPPPLPAPPPPPPQPAKDDARAKCLAKVEAAKKNKVDHRQQALALIEEAVALDPTCADAHFERSQILMLVGRNAEGMEALDRAIEQNPDHAQALATRALSRKHQHPDESLADAKKAVAIDASKFPYFALAEVHITRGEYTDALAANDRAIELDARNANAHRLRAECLLKLGRLDAALTSVRRAGQIAPKLANVTELEAEILVARGDFEAAATIAQVALDAHERSARAHIARGDALIGLERHPAAIACFDRALQLEPNNRRAFVRRAVVKKHLGDRAGALADAKKALELAGESADAKIIRELIGEIERGD